MEVQNQALNGSRNAYAAMLLRQYPWLRGRLREAEVPVAISWRKPETLFGISLLFIGAFTAADMLLHLGAFGSVWVGLLLAAAGLALAYGGVWALFFAGRAYVLVTSERVIYQKAGPLGRGGKSVAMARAEIRRARLLKSTVMYRILREDGGIALTTRDGHTLFIPSVRDGEAILDALREKGPA